MRRLLLLRRLRWQAGGAVVDAGGCVCVCGGGWMDGWREGGREEGKGKDLGSGVELRTHGHTNTHGR
jgi:hypothetical protein